MKTLLFAIIASLLVSGCSNNTTDPETQIDPYEAITGGTKNFQSQFEALTHTVLETQTYFYGKSSLKGANKEEFYKSIIPNRSEYYLICLIKSRKNGTTQNSDTWSSYGALSFYDKDSVVFVIESPTTQPPSVNHEIATIAIKGTHNIKNKTNFFTIKGNTYLLQNPDKNIWKEYKEAGYENKEINFILKQ